MGQVGNINREEKKSIVSNSKKNQMNLWNRNYYHQHGKKIKVEKVELIMHAFI